MRLIQDVCEQTGVWIERGRCPDVSRRGQERPTSAWPPPSVWLQYAAPTWTSLVLFLQRFDQTEGAYVADMTIAFRRQEPRFLISLKTAIAPCWCDRQ